MVYEVYISPLEKKILKKVMFKKKIERKKRGREENKLLIKERKYLERQAEINFKREQQRKIMQEIKSKMEEVKNEQ